MLPLKRFCPSFLSMPALVIGSLIPDAAYLFGELKLDEVSHTAWGIGLFCLPAGLLLTYLFYWIRSKSGTILPERHRRLLLVCNCPRSVSLLGITVSVLVGAVTHLAWDAFTHRGGWVVQQFPLLNSRIGSFAGHNVRVCRVLWYLSSFAGVACVYLVFRKAQKEVKAANTSYAAPLPAGERGVSMLELLKACIVATLVLPIELVHDLVRSPAGPLLVLMLTVLLVVVVVWISSRKSSP